MGTDDLSRGAAPDPRMQVAWKREAARAAVAAIPDGAVLGLGSGSTAEIMVEELAARVRAGLRVTGVPTSERIAAVAAQYGIPLAELDTVEMLTLSIDGADEVALPGLDLIKGLGGALLREKMIAAASRHRLIIVDATKLSNEPLGARHAIPVEVAPFGWRHTAGRLVALGARPVLRLSPQPGPQGAPVPFVTDGGHYILDCAFGPIADPAGLAARLKSVVGVMEHGLFVGMTERVFVAGPEGVRVYDRQG